MVHDLEASERVMGAFLTFLFTQGRGQEEGEVEVGEGGEVEDVYTHVTPETKAKLFDRCLSGGSVSFTSSAASASSPSSSFASPFFSLLLMTPGHFPVCAYESGPLNLPTEIQGLLDAFRVFYVHTGVDMYKEYLMAVGFDV